MLARRQVLRLRRELAPLVDGDARILVSGPVAFSARVALIRGSRASAVPLCGDGGGWRADLLCSFVLAALRPLPGVPLRVACVTAKARAGGAASVSWIDVDGVFLLARARMGRRALVVSDLPAPLSPGRHVAHRLPRARTRHCWRTWTFLAR
ncbi:MAG: hypothetical protein C4306_06790 [Thermoleophilia bacterium]